MLNIHTQKRFTAAFFLIIPESDNSLNVCQKAWLNEHPDYKIHFLKKDVEPCCQRKALKYSNKENWVICPVKHKIQTKTIVTMQK